MVKDAETHSEEDRKERERIEARNEADTLVYSTEKMLRENGAALSPEERAKIESGIADLKRAVEGGDANAVKAQGRGLERRRRRREAGSTRTGRSAAGCAGPETGSADSVHDGAPSSAAQQDRGEKVYDAECEVMDDERKAG